MALNSKNDRVSTTGPVAATLEHRLDGLHWQKFRVGMPEELMEVGRRCATHASREWLTRDFDQELYDERGLPR
ncbi:MAG: type II toxin-antitoxin system VapB family antitoxin [Bryobacteraceae bacterium]|nr:type II toxin-antitoxin system VapB family antitoxin [Bryobacteraceae bacterium]